MRKFFIVFGFFLSLLLLFGYFYFPSESMDELYKKIPEQVRENSQLIAAYYSSKTGFSGFREYQFAFYNSREKEWTIYTFRYTKAFGIMPTVTHQEITCKSLFDYSILSNDVEALLEFRPCDNCRALLYRGHWYINEEIDGIYPSLNNILSERETYTGITGFKSKEITSEEVETLHGDAWVHRVFGVWPGILLLPTGEESELRALWVEITVKNGSSVILKAHYPRNITLTKVVPINSTAGAGSYFMGTSKTFSSRNINLEVLKENYQSLEHTIDYWVLVISIADNPITGRVWWINTEKHLIGRAFVYPEAQIERRERFSDLKASCLAEGAS